MNSIFQSKEWEQFKLATGYQKSYRVDGILVLQKRLPLGYSMLYSPLARIQNTADRIQQLIEQARKIARENKAIFYRLEIDQPKELNSDPPLADLILNSGFIKAFEEMQPEHTLILDLTKSEDELLAEMKQKGRYNIKIAQQNEIEIRQEKLSGKLLDDFYTMYAKTGQRHHISYRGKKYFATLLDILGQSGYASVYGAYKGNVPLAAAIFVASGETIVYMFGASSDEYRNLMAPYLLHWTAIRDAKSQGFKHYDFFGIAPDENPRHPWAGVTRFKRQFGGEQQDILGSYDLVMKPLEYQLFKIAEKIRR